MGTSAIDMKLSRLSLTIDGSVAGVELRNPPLNVIDIAMMEELAQIFADLEVNSGVSVIRISGSGKSFSAGVDVGAHTPEKVEEMLAKFHTVIRALIATTKITVAIVHGHCLGGGAELAMVCDMAYTAENAQWGFPEIRLACYPPVACTALAALVGQKRAAELILTGQTIEGKTAAEIGLATSAVTEKKLEPVVEQRIARLRALSPAALSMAKKAFYAWDSMHFDKGLARAEKVYFEDLMKTADAHEGIRAFREKRPPRWLGK